MGLRVRVVLVVLLLSRWLRCAFRSALSLADRRTAALAAERDRQLVCARRRGGHSGHPVAASRRPLPRGVREKGCSSSTPTVRTLAAAVSTSPTRASRPRRPMRLSTRPPRVGSASCRGRPASACSLRGCRNDGELVGAVVVAVDTSAAPRCGAGVGVGGGRLSGVPVLAAVVARGSDRWVLRPLDGLERAVAEMTEGIAGPPADVAGPPELRHFTSAFNTMAQVVRASLDRQRRLVADASHQLRNPLAAVRLRADTLENYVCRRRVADIQLNDRGAGPFRKPARAAAAPGPRRTGQRQPQGRSIHRSRRVDGPRRRDRGTHRVLATDPRRRGPATPEPLESSRA